MKIRRARLGRGERVITLDDLRYSTSQMLGFRRGLAAEIDNAVESERQERLASMSAQDVVRELSADFNKYVALNHDYVKVAAGIRANLDRLKPRFTGLSESQEAQAIEGAARRLEDLPSLHQLLVKPELAREWTDQAKHRLLATVDSYFFYLRPMAEERGIDLKRPTCRQSESQAQVYGSRRVLGGIVLQLLDNAISYSDPGESVSIAVDDPGDDSSVSIICESMGPRIFPEEMDLIFQPFFRGRAATSVKDGGGVGLAIVKVAAKALEGSVSVEQDGSGDRRLTRFTVTLPKA